MKQRLLTSAMADGLLQFLVENVQPDEFINAARVEEILQATGLTFNELSAFLSEFQRKGLIEHFDMRGMMVDFLVRRELHRFFELGGFGGELARLNAELLVLKSQLQDSKAEQAHQTVSTVANVISIINTLTIGLLSKYKG